MLECTRLRVGVGAVMVAALVLAACGSDSASESSPVASNAATPSTEDAAAVTTTSETPTTSAEPSTSSAPDETDAVVDMSDTSACVTGTWDLLGDQVAGIFDQGMLATIPELDATVEGNGRVELRGDGTYSFSPAYSIVLSAGGETGTGSWSGMQEGTWSVEGLTLTMSQTSNDITGSVTVMGATFPLEQPISLNGSAEVVSCDPATFTISTPAPTGAIVQTLVLAG